MTDTAQEDEIEGPVARLETAFEQGGYHPGTLRDAILFIPAQAAELASLRRAISDHQDLSRKVAASLQGQLAAESQRCGRWEARALLAESKFAEANRYVNELVDAKATIAKQAQEIAEMREALRELIGLIGRVMAPGYDNIALQEARSLSNTKGSEDDR